MLDPADITGALDDFRGVARLFPLPNLVMFPRVVQPLHIFEPRYRALLTESLASDKLFALSVLAPGWEANYEGRPPLHPIACLCKIATHQELPDGRSNVLLVGLKRVRLKRELAPTKLFREAEVELLEDVYPAAGDARRGSLQRDLIAHFKKSLPTLDELQEQIEQLLSQQIPLGLLTDLVTFAAKLPVEAKVELLFETNVDRRAELLLNSLSSGSGLRNKPPFPPEFSVN